MINNTRLTIEMSYAEMGVIKDLYDLLEDCPLELTDSDYVAIFRGIACGWTDGIETSIGDEVVIESLED